MTDAMKNPKMTSPRVASPEMPEAFSLLPPDLNIDLLKSWISSYYGILFQDIPMQEGLMALASKFKGTYVSRKSAPLAAGIDTEKLQEAWSTVVRDNPILRTRIVSHPHLGLFQVVCKDAIVKLHTNPIGGPLMGLGTPLVHASLHQHGSGSKLMITIHHAVFDAWSLSLMLEALDEAYREKPSSPYMPFSYFINHVQKLSLDAARLYWAKYLTDLAAPQFPCLPFSDYQPSPNQSHRHLIKGISWNRRGVTPSNIVRAGYGLLVSRLASSADAIFGATVIGRRSDLPEAKHVVGPMIATVPVRVQVDPALDVSSFLEGVQQQARDSTAFEHLGLSRISNTDEKSRLACKFQSLLVVQRTPDRHHRSTVLSGLANEPVVDGARGSYSHYALILECTLLDNGFELHMEYDDNVLERGVPESMAFQLEHIIRHLGDITQSHRRLDEISWLCKNDLDSVLSWNSSSFPPVQSCVQTLFTEAALKAPLAQAICAWDGTLTYSELDELSSKLAHHLLQRGLCASHHRGSMLLPLYFEKSMWAPVSILAVWKAGGSAALMDSTLPKARLDLIASQLSPTLVLASRARLEEAQDTWGSKAVMIDLEFLGSLDAVSEAITLPAVGSQDPACTLFTSGSTGIPKGIVLQHTQLCSAITYQQAALNISSITRLYEFAAYAFDLTWFTWNVLCAGGCVCIPSDTSRRNDFGGSFEALQANTTFITPSVLRTLQPNKVQGLRTLILGGESVDPTDLTRWSYVPRVINTYGPAECTMSSTVTHLDTKCDVPKGIIGKGLGANTWLVDLSGKQLAPVGGIGEIWIEGPNVAFGYLDNELQTQKSFFRKPEWLSEAIQQQLGRKTMRFYKTGDLARYHATNGSLAFVGRQDNQVKLNGQRVELEEIQQLAQSALAEATEYRVQVEAIVPQKQESKMLIGFVVGPKQEVGEASTAGQLDPVVVNLAQGIIRNIRGKLAEYMVPNTFIHLDALPMTPTGKVDHRRLREIGSAFTMHQLSCLNLLRNTDRISPETLNEKVLVKVWAELLGVSPELISVQDSFYHLGGNSITAMRMMALVEAHGFTISALDVMKNPVLSDQALLLEKKQPHEQRAKLANYYPFSLMEERIVNVQLAISEAAEACGMDKSQIIDMYPCTPFQEGVMAATAKDPTKYTARFTYDIDNDVDGQRLIQSLQSICRQVDILRTRIVNISEMALVQVVSSEPCPVVQWQNVTEYQSSQPTSFSLGTVLARFDIVQKSSQLGCRRALIITAHHAIYDGWSLRLIIDGLSDLYHGTPLQQGTAFSAFIKHTVTDVDSEATRKFWLNALDAADITTFPDTPKATYTPSKLESITHRITDLRSTRGGEIFTSTILMTSWALVASRYSDFDRVAFGVVNSGRQAAIPGIVGVIGPTIAVTPVRVHLPSNQSLSKVLESVQAMSLSAIPFEQTGIQRIKRFSQDLERACDFQTLLVIQPPLRSQRSKAKGQEFSLQLSPSKDDTFQSLGHAAHDFGSQALSIQVFLEDGSGCVLQVTHDTSVLSADSAQLLIGQFETVISQISESLNTNSSENLLVRQITLQHDDSIRQIWRWNSAAPPMIRGCVHDLFHSAATEHFDKIAVCSSAGDLTYGQLDKMSTLLAHYLLSLGLHPRSIVPLCFEKSIWTIVAILAVMKAGAAAVTMDVGLPLERLRQVVFQADPYLVLCSSGASEIATKLIDSDASQKILTISPRLFKELRSSPWPSPLVLPSVDPSDPLYVVFTSGSTGKPKGSIISHENFCSVIHYQRQALRYSSVSRVFDFVSYAFDVTWPNILQTLTAGGCVCVPSEDERKNDISGAIRRLRATAVHVPPSVARLIDPTEVPSINLVVVGGEPVVLSDVTRWGTGVEVVQVYGPAECTPPVMVSYNVFNEAWMKNIGRGYGVVPWILDLDDCQKLAPIGVVGELGLEGPLIGLGYLNEPDQTAASFLQDPEWLVRGCSDNTGRKGRLYRTGDLAKFESDGSVVFMGRRDSQVKIRGQRIELGDVEANIEALLKRKSCQTDLVVELATPVDTTTPMLVAFIVHDGDASSQNGSKGTKSTLSFQDMAAFIAQGLSNSLPMYMLPSAYVPVKDMPVTGTGKTDRRRLRELGSSMALEDITMFNPGRQPKSPPKTEWGRRLQHLVSSILDISIEKVGADDSLFQIGGDSIAAMRLVAMVRKTYGATISVTEIFKTPQLSALAELIEVRAAEHQGHTNPTASGEGQPQDTPPLSLLRVSDPTKVRSEAAKMLGVPNNAIEDMYPCTAFQEGLLASTSIESGSYVFIRRFKLRTSIDISLFHQAWKTVVDHTPILRTRVIEMPSIGLLQVVLQPTSGPLWIETVGEVRSQDEGLGQPLVDYNLMRDASDGLYFSWRMHHCLYDGISIRIMMNAVVRAYEGSSLPSTVPFKHFIEYVDKQSWAHSHDGVAAFWSRQLGRSSARPFPTLPMSSYRPKSDATRVRNLAGFVWPQNGFTPSNIIRTAWALLSARYTGSDDAIFGVVVNGRQAPIVDIETLVGPTVATVPVLVHIDEEADISSMFHQVQQQAVEMIPYEQTGLHHIRRIGSDIDKHSQFNALLLVQFNHESEDEKLDCPLWTDCSAEVMATGSGIDVLQSTSPLGSFNSHALMLQVEILRKGDSIIKIEFDSAVIKEDAVERLVDQFEIGLRQLCSADVFNTKVKDISFLSNQDLDNIWHSNVEVPAPIHKCVHHMIQDVSFAQPERLAIDSHDGQLTYMELEAATTAIAEVIINRGVQQGSIIPVLMEKSRWVPVAALAVLKAGCIVALLDTSLPSKRLQSILAQFKPNFSICSLESGNLAQKILPENTLVASEENIANLTSTWKASGAAVALPQVSPSSPAYIIFTSGSTGTAKGVLISHANCCSSVYYQSEALGYTKASRVYDFASYSFDVCWSNMIHTLSAGACLCIPSETERKDNLADSLARFAVDTVELTPSVSRTLHPASIAAGGLKTLNLGGEAVTSDDVARWTSHIDLLLNSYGPAEATPTSTVARLTGNLSGNVPIGVGVGTSCWVVSSNGKLAPVGTVGELYLEGPLVGLGYLGDQPKTAASFVRDPEWLLAGHAKRSIAGRSGVVYKTGDLVKLGADGNLFYVGRGDSQIKINGQRMELDEIERQIQQNLPTEPQATVVVELFAPEKNNDSNQTDKLLVAALSLPGKRQADLERVRGVVTKLALDLDSALASSLPRYMIPPVFIHLDHIPLGPTGKSDRQAFKKVLESKTKESLMAENLLISARSSTMEQPQTKTQKILQELWANLIGIRHTSIGLDDNFFRLGGDSVMAMRLVSLARLQHVGISVAQVLRLPQLRALSDAVDEESRLSAHHGNGLENDMMATPVPRPFSLLKDGSDIQNSCQEAAAVLNIRTDQIDDMYPCTSLQEGLLAATEQQPGKYIARFHFQLPDDVDLNRFKNAWRVVTARTPILRTRFVSTRHLGTVQVVMKDNMQFDEYPEWRQHAVANQRPAPLGIGTSVSRYELVKSSNHGSVFVWTVHHAIYDAWSLQKLLNAVEDEYTNGKELVMTPFSTFIRHVAGSENEAAAKFWVSELKSSQAVPFPKLPSNNYQPQPASRFSHTIEGLDLRNTSFANSTCIQAAWVILASLHSNSLDVIFGLIVSGRQSSLAGVADVAGPTIATVPVRTLVDYSETVHGFLNRIQGHSAVLIPFEQTGLQKIRQFGSGLGSKSAVNTLLSIQNKEPQTGNGISKLFSQELAIQVEALATVPNGTLAPEAGTFNTNALMATFFVSPNGIDMELSFDETVIESSLVKRMSLQFETILRQLCNSDSQNQVLTHLTATSDRDLEDIWNWNPPPQPSVQKCVHHMIHDNMMQKGLQNHLAIDAHDGQCTYAELDSLSTALASILFKTGMVKPNTVVPLLFEKSKWAIIAIVALWKTGSAVLTLDCRLSDERMQVILQQISPRLALISRDNTARSPRVFDDRCQALIVDADLLLKNCANGDVEQRLTSPPGSRLPEPSDMLYVVFTSGSTGAPKGVVLHHHHLASAVVYQSEHLGYHEQSRVYDFAAFSFDVSWSNIVQTLATGGCLCIPTEGERQNNLTASFCALEANLIDITPSVSRTIDPASMIGLKTLLFGGEAVLGSDVARWKAARPDATIKNTYGPAECTPKTTAFELTERDMAATTTRFGVGLGLNLWLIDQHRNDLAAIGTVGELWVEGPLLAAGYFNNPVKTAAAFVDSPKWLTAGARGHAGRKGRLYRTGDLCRYNMDGTMSYISRCGTQIKIGGHRVEVVEIEHLAQEWLSGAGLTAAVDIITPKNGQNNILVAFVAPSNGASATKEQIALGATGLKEQLGQRLAWELVPRFCIAIEKMPVTTSSKVDRRQLAALGRSMTLEQIISCDGSVQRAAKRAPETEAGRFLRHIWAEVLSIKEDMMGTDDSFIALGGDSISAMKVVSLALQLGYRLKTADVLRMPVLNDQAMLLRKNRDKADSKNGKMKPATTNGLGHLNQRPVTSFQRYAIDAARQEPPGWYGFSETDFPESCTTCRVKEICQWLWATFPNLRAIFFQDSGAYLQSYASPSTAPAVYVLDDVADVEAASQDVAGANGRQPLELGQPFTKFWIIESPEKRVRLMVRLSHSQYDGICLNDMLLQLAMYTQSGVYRPPVHFDRYLAAVEVAKGNGGVEYWRNLLQGATISRSTAARRSPRTAKEGPVDADSSIRLRLPPLSSNKTATPATIFTAMCVRAISRVLQSPQVAFGRLVSGRAMDPDLATAAGPCINFVPTRVDDAEGDDLLAVLQQQNLDGMPYEGISLDDIFGASTAEATAGFGFTVQYQNVEEVDGKSSNVNDNPEFHFGWRHGQSSANTLYPNCIAIRAEDSSFDADGGWHLHVSGPRLADDLKERVAKEIVGFAATGLFKDIHNGLL